MPPLVVAPSAGTGSLTHQYPGFVRTTDPAGNVDFCGEGYLGPVTARTR